MVLVGFAEIIKIYVFVFILHIHHTMAAVHHMLLATAGIFELLRAEETDLAQVDSLSRVCEETFEVNQTINIQNSKGVFYSHVVNILFDTVAFLIAK